MRKRIPLNDNWAFVHENIPLADQIPFGAESVTLPHTWNAVDGHDGHAIDLPAKDWALGDLSGKPEDRYDRGTYWYYREFDAPEQPLPGGRLYVEIPAAALQAARLFGVPRRRDGFSKRAGKEPARGLRQQ